jgi:hypothetical protein
VIRPELLGSLVTGLCVGKVFVLAFNIEILKQVFSETEQHENMVGSATVGCFSDFLKSYRQ